MNAALFIPLFFGLAGVEVSLSGISGIFFVNLALLITVALLFGVSLTYYISRRVLQPKINLAPKQVAAILGGRGAIGIVIASVALNAKIIPETGFSLVILATLVMSLAIPYLTGSMKGKPLPKEPIECILD